MQGVCFAWSFHIPQMHDYNRQQGISFRRRAGCRDQLSRNGKQVTFTSLACAMAAFEMAWLSPEWTWQQEMPCNWQFTAVTGVNDRRLQNNAGFMYVRGQTDGRYQRFISTVHDEGAEVWIFTAATREKLMVRRVGGALMWCIHADHVPEEGLVRLGFDEPTYVACNDKAYSREASSKE